MAEAQPSTPLSLRLMRWLRLAPPPAPPARRLRSIPGGRSPAPRGPSVEPTEVWRAPAPAPTLDSEALRNGLKQAIVAERSAIDEKDGASAASDRLFLTRLIETLECETLSLPVFPQVSIELDRLLRASDPPQRKVIDIVTREAELVRRLWQVANSAVYRVQVADLDRAIARIGYDEVWRVGMAACLDGEMFAGGVHHEQMVRFRATGVVAGHVASWLDRSPRGEAYLAGLLHAVGAMFILKHAALPRRRSPSAACLSRILERYQASMAVLMVQTWGLGDRVAAGVGFYADPERAPAEDRAFVESVRAAVVGATLGRTARTTNAATARAVLTAMVDPALDVDAIMKWSDRAWRAERPSRGRESKMPASFAKSA